MRNSKKPLIIAIIILLIVIATALILFTKFKKQILPAAISEKVVYVPADGSITEEMENAYPYLNDVVYTGPFEDMDVYKYPFEKTDSYLKNKDVEDKPNKNAVISTAEGFVSSLYAGGYRNIIDDPDAYRDTLLSYLDPDSAFLVPDTFSVSGNSDAMPGKDYAEEMSDYIVLHEINAESQFVTNESLVYNDRSAWVRGIIKTDIQNIKDGGDITPGEYESRIDIAMILNPTKKYGYQIIYVRPVPFGDGEPWEHMSDSEKGAD